MAVDNNTILAKAWLEGTNDYQQRIPNPTQEGIAKTIDALFEPMNRNYLNQFMDVLINRIGATYVHDTRWDNPLAAFKRQMLNYGSTIQEIAPKWVKAHSYMDDSETLLKMERPEVQAWYHSVNREDYYPITIQLDELRMAFTDEYGLNNLVASIMGVPQNSDSYDEYNIMKQLMAEYENRWGFFKVNLSAVPADEATGKEFLTKLRTITGKLQFPSTLYNSVAIEDIPVFAKMDELILLVTPEVQASLSVEVLASLFNMDKADVQVRQVVVDEFPIPNAVAMLTTRDWFVCSDTVYTTTSFYNPETLTTKYYLHHWGVYSVSPFVPAVLFTTDEATEVPRIKQTVTGIALAAEDATIEAGGETQLTVTLQGTVDDEGGSIVVAPDAAVYEVVAVEGGYELNQNTYVDRNGVLHIQKSGNIEGKQVKVTATATYINPSGKTTSYSADTTITVKSAD